MKVGVTYTYLFSGDALTILVKVRVGVTYPNNKNVMDCWGGGGGGGGGTYPDNKNDDWKVGGGGGGGLNCKTMW